MADSFFGFDTTLDSALEDGLDCPLDDLGEEEEYDALNDETFGAEASIGDWEKDHEKLAEITESSRPQHQNTKNKKNSVNIDVENNLSHLVLDDKQGIVPRPDVWGSPSNLPLPKVKPRLSLPATLKNACTVEEIERGLIASRPSPNLNKPHPHQQQQQQRKSDGSLLFENLSLNEKFQVNGLPPPRFPALGLPGAHPMVMPSMRLPHPQFMPPPRVLLNQPGNVLRYPLPPHLMLPHAVQRQALHGSYGFPQPPPPPPPHSNVGGPQFLRTDHIMPAFPNNQSNHQQHQHPYPHAGNQRSQNRSYQHNEQQGGHQPFFRNNQGPYRNHDRNNQRHYQHHQSNGTNASGEYDEYAGLMSNREKQWLINIQLLQLNTIQPYVDDYYYTVFCDKQNKQHVNQQQKDKKHLNNNGYHRDSRDWEPTPPVSRTVYTPAQFENSLGKLQFSSVTAPRKIIDMDVVSNSDSQSTQLQQRDTKKTRQLLLEIERLYIVQLKLEDLSNPLASIPEPQQQQEETEANTIKTEPELISMILLSLQQLVQNDKLANMLSIRKAKTLLLRFLPHLNVIEHSEQLRELWIAIFKGLAVISRRDCHLLTNFYSEFRRWLNTLENFDTLLLLTGALSDLTGHPVKNSSLAFALTNKFGVSVISAIFQQAEQLCTVANFLPSEWINFVVTITEIISDSLPCVAPCQPIAVNTLTQHLNRISSLKIERYATLERLLTDANPLR